MTSWFHPSLLERSGCPPRGSGHTRGRREHHPRAGEYPHPLVREGRRPREGERSRAACETSEHADTHVADVAVVIEGDEWSVTQKSFAGQPTTDARQVNSS